MFKCQAAPDIPDSGGNDTELATYIVRVVLAHEDCEAQLGMVRNHLAINGVIIAKEMAPQAYDKPVTHPQKFFGLF